MILRKYQDLKRMILREQIVVSYIAPSNGEGNDSGFDEEDWKGIDMKQKNIKKHKNQSRRRLYNFRKYTGRLS